MSARLWGPALLILAACSISNSIDPAGYRCDDTNACPTGYACVDAVCREMGSVATDAGSRCTGIVCERPPVCVAASVQTFVGTCNLATGGCEFTATETSCQNGCANASCVDACQGVACVTPPAAACFDGTLRSYQPAGTCDGTTGLCAYAPVDTVCANGCAAGACVDQDLCKDVSCITPPAPACAGAVATTYAATGTCESATGSCTYASTSTPCADRCLSGACVTDALTFTQTGPRVRFAITAVDVAPNSGGNTVLAAGANGLVARWNGSEWTTLATPAKRTITAVHFVGPNAAWLVGGDRTVWTYRAGTISSVASVPQTGSASFIGVYGRNDANVLVIDAAGGWHKWGGSSWVNGALKSSGGPYAMTSVFVDETNRERIAGTCGTSTHTTCVAYRDPSSGLDFAIDLDAQGDNSGCSALGPWVDAPPAVGGPDVLCGKANNELRRHTPFGFSLLPAPALARGGSVLGITQGPGRAVFVLAADTTFGAGALYRLNRTSLTTVAADELLQTQMGDAHLSPNESSGVVVADAWPAANVNNVFHRSAVVDEALDLGLNWEALTATDGDDLVLVSDDGDVAILKKNAKVFSLANRPRNASVYGAEALHGTGTLIVGDDFINGHALLERYQPGLGFSPIAVNVNDEVLTSVCRISDSEAYAVGFGGAIYKVNSASTTALKMTSGTQKDLWSVSCGSAGRATACGENGTVLKLTNGTWSALTPAFPTSAQLIQCALSGDSVWALGRDGVIAHLDPGATTWASLPAKASLSRFVVRSPTDVYGVVNGASSGDVFRFNGSGWAPAKHFEGVVRGGVQISAKVLLGGTNGLLVEGR